MKNLPPCHSRARRFFSFVTDHAASIATLASALILIAAACTPGVALNSNLDDFLARDHPEARFREQVRSQFGVQDPLMVLVTNDGEHGVFTPHTLTLIADLTGQFRRLDAIASQHVTSLTNVAAPRSTEEGVSTSPLFTGPVVDQNQADGIRHAAFGLKLYGNRLLSNDGHTALIAIELSNPAAALEVYDEVLKITDSSPVLEEQLHVAGVPASSATLMRYILHDIALLVILNIGVITAILFAAFRTKHGMLLPNLLAGGTAIAGLGLLVVTGGTISVISNALPAILIALAVADGVHIMSHYYEGLAREPGLDQREQVIRTMVAMWRPCTVTTVTDIGGFLAIMAATSMPPMREFALYGATGMAIELILALTFLPSLMTLTKPPASPSYAGFAGPEHNVANSILIRFGQFSLRHAKAIVAVSVVVIGIGVLGATRVAVNDSRLAQFHPQARARIANEELRSRLGGADLLDIVVSTSQDAGMLEPQILSKIEDLENQLRQLPQVADVTSIVDYLKEMHHAMRDSGAERWRLPDSAALNAQYLSLWEDREIGQWIDFLHGSAHLRVLSSAHWYVDAVPLIAKVQEILGRTFADTSASARLTGSLYVGYQWMSGLGPFQVWSTAAALFIVWATMAIAFRSVTAGVFAVIPVAASVILVYGFMGWTGIWLGIGASIFAAVAIGTGVDFAVHTVDRLLVLAREDSYKFEKAIETLWPSTGRALFFSGACNILGIGVVGTSQVPAVGTFGVIVMVSMTVSLVVSLTVLPALIEVLRQALGWSGIR